MKFLKKFALASVLFVAVPAGALHLILNVMKGEAGQITEALVLIKKNIPFFTSDPELDGSLSSPPEVAVAAVNDSPMTDTSFREVRLGDVIRTDDIKKAIDQDENINKIPIEFVDQSLSEIDLLRDRLDRVSPDFKIPPELMGRVGFWFNIYAKYTSHFSVIHDIDRPWIVYKVVDMRSVYDEKINRYQKDAKDRKMIAQAKVEVRGILLGLSRKQNFKNLSTEETRYFKLLEGVPGKKRQAVFAKAAQNFRDQRGQKNFFRHGLMTGSKYISEMETIFARYDLPIELTRLPLVESSFNEQAQSKVGASGVWQFMPNMGKHYLKVEPHVDERNSPIKATEAAAKLMLSNFDALHSWPLAVTAYNHGAGGLLRAQKKFKTKSLNEIIEKNTSKSFGFASQNYYSEFLAALYAERYQEEIFGQIAKHPPLLADEINLKQKIKATTLISLLGITMEELKLYNPDLKNLFTAGNGVLPAGYRVRVPKEQRVHIENLKKHAEEEPSSDSKSKDSLKI